MQTAWLFEDDGEEYPSKRKIWWFKCKPLFCVIRPAHFVSNNSNEEQRITQPNVIKERNVDVGIWDGRVETFWSQMNNSNTISTYIGWIFDKGP